MKTATYIRLVIAQLFLSYPLFAADKIEPNFIFKLHADPPAPCVAKRIDDNSSGIAIFPKGKSDEQLRGIMGGFAAVSLSKGANLLAPTNTTTVYTAVFYQEKPVNEVGIYGYEFAIPIDSSMFEARTELNGKVFVINNRTLILLWHESLEKTVDCFQALETKLVKLNEPTQ